MMRSYCCKAILLFPCLLLPAPAGNPLPVRPDSAPLQAPAPSTQEMGALLQKAYDTMDLRVADWGFNDRRAAMIRKSLEQVSDTKAKIPLQFALAKELLSDGQNAESIKGLDELEKSIIDSRVILQPAEIQTIRMMRAQAYLRIGETENCWFFHEFRG